MIITQKKPIEELMALVGDAKTVAIVGCNSCATACHTGGEPEVAALKQTLEAAGKTVVGTTVADYCCMNLGVKGKMKPLVAAKPDCWQEISFQLQSERNLYAVLQKSRLWH